MIRNDGARKTPVYYSEDHRFMRFLVPTGSRSRSRLRHRRIAGLARAVARRRRRFRPNMIALARQNHPNLTFHVGDIETGDAAAPRAVRLYRPVRHHRHAGRHRGARPAASAVRTVDPRHHRLLLAIVGTDPDACGTPALAVPQPPLNYLVNNDFLNIIDLADFEPIKGEYRQLVPRRLFGLGTFINIIAPTARHPAAVPAQLLRRALAAQAAHRHVGQRHHPLPQRARQYRGRDHAHAGVRPRAGDRLYRRQFIRRHLRGMPARERGLCRQARHQGAAAGRQGQRRRRAQGLARMQPATS